MLAHALGHPEPASLHCVQGQAEDTLCFHVLYACMAALCGCCTAMLAHTLAHLEIASLHCVQGQADDTGCFHLLCACMAACAVVALPCLHIHWPCLHIHCLILRWHHFIVCRDKLTTQAGLTNVLGALYASVLFFAIINALVVQPVISAERAVSYRERAAGMYSFAPWVLALVRLYLPVSLSLSVCLCLSHRLSEYHLLQEGCWNVLLCPLGPCPGKALSVCVCLSLSLSLCLPECCSPQESYLCSVGKCLR